MNERVSVERPRWAALRVTLAGAVLVLSWALTIFASVIWAALFFFLAAIPATVGAAQILAGLRMFRATGQGLVLVMSAVGVLLGLIGFPGAALPAETVGPSVEIWRTVLSGLVVAGNVFVVIVAVRDLPQMPSRRIGD